MLTESFSKKLNNISSDLGMNPRDLLLVMYLESGVNPAAVNPSGRATGLIQFMPSTLKGMGLPSNDIANFGKKSAEDQLDYVKQYIQNHRALIGGRSFTSATQYYVANFYPLALQRWRGSSPERNANIIVVSSKSNDPREREAYKENRILDTDKDGIITVRDITNILMTMEKSRGFQQMVGQFNEVAGNGVVTERRLKIGPTNKPVEKPINSMLASFLRGLNSLLDSLTATSVKSNINKYGSEFPTNKYLISINSNSDFSSKLEFARILSLALKEEIDSNSEIYTDGKNVEMQCVINAEQNRGLEVVNELCVALSDTFNIATRKIGSIIINILISANKNPHYQELDIKLAEINYRKFNFKFIK